MRVFFFSFLLVFFCSIPPVLADDTILLKKVNGHEILSFGEQVLRDTENHIVEPVLVSLKSSSTKFVTWAEEQDDEKKSFFSIYIKSRGWQGSKEISNIIKLRLGSFDPLIDPSILNYFVKHPLTENLEIKEYPKKLFLLQFKTFGIEEFRRRIRKLGCEILQYVPDNTHIVRMDKRIANLVAKLPFVRWLGEFPFGFKLENKLHSNLTEEKNQNYLIEVFSKIEKEKAIYGIKKMGGYVIRPFPGSSFFEAVLDRKQLIKTVSFPEVAWIEESTAIGEDMNNARIQGGADYLESSVDVPGYSGVGIRGHVFEGIYANHHDLVANDYREAPIPMFHASPASHGHATFGIIFGSGEGKIKARGLLPNGQGLFTNYDFLYDPSVDSPFDSTDPQSRFELVKYLIDEQEVMFQTASWGHTLTKEYTARSAVLDEVIFDLDIPITQSQSNSGTRFSRPQAWAKNVISVGGVFHYNNLDSRDDSWDRGASIGPAEDGRIKPDVCAYYDKILTLGPTAYTSFSGTSGATPIVAGHVGLILEMWTDGLFGNVLKEPDGSRFKNRPHFTTTKALLINSARQYLFSGASHDLTRVHQGWGFPAVDNLYNLREKIFVVDEEDVLDEFESMIYEVTVTEETPELKVTLLYADPPAALSSEVTLVNDLDLKVTSPNGTTYWGNYGLLTSRHSSPDGQPDKADVVENVFIKEPEKGTWAIEIIAEKINEDAHLETEKVDIDFALVISGVAG